MDNSFLEILKRACLQRKDKGELKYMTLVIGIGEVSLFFGETTVILSLQ